MQQAKMQKSPESKLENPRFENGRAMAIAGIRMHYTEAPFEGMPAQWQRLMSYLGKIPGQVDRKAYGLCFQQPNGVDYLSGVEVSGSYALPSEFTTVNIPAQKYAVFSHRGHVSKIHDTCQLVSEWFPTSGSEPAKAVGAPDFFELYTEEFNPSTGVGGIEVWFPIEA